MTDEFKGVFRFLWMVFVVFVSTVLGIALFLPSLGWSMALSRKTTNKVLDWQEKSHV